jgi:hypothetical protein
VVVGGSSRHPFVCLHAAGVPPQYYVCTAAEARAIAERFATRDIVNLSDIKKIDALGKWSKIE